MTLLLAALLTTRVSASTQEFASVVGYVQTATPGCREMSRGETTPLRVLTRVWMGTYLQVPKGGNLVVVFRQSGSRFRLVGPGQARVGESALTGLKGARVQSLGRLDLRLASGAARDLRYGRSTGGTTQGAGGVGAPDPVPNGPMPEAPAPPIASLPPVPPLVRALSPNGLVREAPAAIVIRPAPSNGPVTVVVSRERRRDEKTLELTMKDGAVALPAGFFGEEFVSFRILRGDRRLASGEVRVLTEAQRAELVRTERLAEARGDDDSLLALAVLYDDLRMPEDQDRILRRLLARRPDDEALRDTVEELRRREAMGR